MLQPAPSEPESASPIHIAPSKLCVNSTGESVGHGVFASQNFSAGEQVLGLERALIGSLDTERLTDTCAYCYIWTESSSVGGDLYVPDGTKVQKCAGCQTVRYCSKTCQRQAWKQGHKHECKLLRPMAHRELPKAVFACMQILLRRKYGLLSDEHWGLLCRLQSHVDGFKRNGSYGNIELMAMGAREFSLTQGVFDKDFVVAMYARVLTNSLTLITPTLDPLGIIIDPTLSHINHSCDPNAYIMMDGPQVSIRTLKPIQRNEEILISYIDTTNPYLRRQSELKSRWFFDCKCNKCQQGPSLPEDKWATKAAEMSDRTKEIADKIIKHGGVSKDPANYVGDTRDERRAAAIQEQAFTRYEEARRIKDHKEAIQSLEDAMQLCHQSSLWSLHRQPYAALRDELIVRLLSEDKFLVAWAHCAKRYKYVLPNLYPVPFHPVRVVQIWQMAMLAAYLASTEDGVKAPGVNMGLITMMLVKQVLDLSSFSHGLDNAFTKSVKKKAEELREEVKRNAVAVNKEDMDRELEVQRDMLIQMGDWATV